MDEAAKKQALRMIPYGLFVVTAKNGDDVTSATVNWVTQTSFSPPLVAVGLLYHYGYFRQRLSREGWQEERYGETEPDDLPLHRVNDERGAPLSIEVSMRSTQQLSITLPNEMADLIRAKVATGEYATESEVIRDGLRTLLARDRAAADEHGLAMVFTGLRHFKH